MKNLSTLLPLVLSLALPLQANADEGGKIILAFMDLTPYTFVDGPNKGRGFIDLGMEVVKKRLPQFDYEQMIGFSVRIQEMMKSQPNVCSGELLRTPEREKFMEFSTQPIVRVLPNGLITTRDRLAAFKPFMNDNGELRLDALLADGKYRLLAEKGRTFGAYIDDIVKNPAVQQSVVRTNDVPLLESRILKLSTQKDYDVLIGYAIELKAAVARARLKMDDFAFIPIAGELPLRPIPMSCSKGDKGREFIAAVDKVLAEPAVQREMAQLYRSWLDPETAARYDRLVKASATK